jgi:hypothetical protein
VCVRCVLALSGLDSQKISLQELMHFILLEFSVDASPPALAPSMAAAEMDSSEEEVKETEVSAAANTVKRPSRRSLTSHRADLPGEISAVEFPSYLPFVNRTDQCDQLVLHLQSAYDGQFLLHVKQNTAVDPDEYVKQLGVVYSAGAPGIGMFQSFFFPLFLMIRFELTTSLIVSVSSLYRQNNMGAPGAGSGTSLR